MTNFTEGHANFDLRLSTIIVTGGAGFIGSNLVQHLNNLGEEKITIVDNLKNEAKKVNLENLKYETYIDKIDFINNLNNFDFSNIKVIFHMGACSNTMEDDEKYMMENNLEYSIKLLAKAQKQNMQFIYASSASVYGNGDNGFVEDPQCEQPLNIYAKSKLLFDQHVRAALPSSTIQIAGMRFFNVFGPQEQHKGCMASVVFHFHNQILENGKLKLFEGSEDFVRDFVYVKDVCDIMLHFYKHPEISGIFNCGTGTAVSFKKIADIMVQEYENAEIVYVPFPEKLKGKYQTFTQADLTNLRTNGKYNHDFTSIENAVKKYSSILKNTHVKTA